jgi:hypothetical protein
LKARLWRLVEGPEWRASVEAEGNGVERFDHNLAALLDGIGINPFAYSRPLTAEVEDVRYGTTKDVANGYRLVVFLRLDRQQVTCDLGWVAVEWL